ncbi:MAG TPA: phage tail tube protein [Candidatus Paceibacterota bacterium]
MAVRYVDFAFESTYGTEPASGWVQLRVSDFSPKNAAPLDIPKETTGSTITMQRPRLKGRQCNISFKMYGYHDMVCYPLACAFGAADVDPVSGASGAFSHVFKPGGSSLLSASLRWKQVSSAGTLWFEATGFKVKTVKFTIDANSMPVWQFDGIAKYATNIVAPTPVSDTTAAYVQPVDMSQQAVYQGTYPPGSAWPDPPTKFDITVDNGLTPDWIIKNTRDANRMKLGETVGNASISAFFDTYDGSMTELEDNHASAMGVLTYTAIDDQTDIGTGTPTNPSTTVTVPKPYVDNVSQDNTDTDTMEAGTLDFAYDTTLASNMSFTMVNELASTVYTGH